MKEAILLSMLVKDIGQRLSKKPFTWISWWRGVKWGAFIKIYPPLTQASPLWSRNDTSLKTIQLFGLTPHQLQTEITRYWENPFWRRWFLRLFTSIGSKITIWSYYQRCLSFRAIQKHYPLVEPLLSSEPEQKLISLLVTRLNQDSLRLEQRLEKYSGNFKWIQKNYSLVLTKHENKRRLAFFNLMEKQINKLPPKYDRYSIRRNLEKEYQEVEKMLRAYSKDDQDTPQASAQPETDDNAMVSVGSTTRTGRVVNSSFESDLSCSLTPIHLWVNRKRQVIDVILQEELSVEEQTNKIKTVLEKSLNSLNSIVDPRIESYQHIVKEAIQGRVKYQEVMEWSKSLQSDLLKLYRHGARLFHPDKISGSVGLQMLLTDLFQQFKQASEASIEKIQEGQESLRAWFGQSFEFELRIRKLLQEMEEERIKHNEYMEKRFKELDDAIEKLREGLVEMSIKLNTNQEALLTIQEDSKINKEKAKNLEKKLDINDKEIKKLTKLAKQFLAISESRSEGQEEYENPNSSSLLRP